MTRRSSYHRSYLAHEVYLLLLHRLHGTRERSSNLHHAGWLLALQHQWSSVRRRPHHRRGSRRRNAPASSLVDTPVDLQDISLGDRARHWTAVVIERRKDFRSHPLEIYRRRWEGLNDWSPPVRLFYRALDCLLERYEFTGCAACVELE
jgi:hypothetical protein